MINRIRVLIASLASVLLLGFAGSSAVLADADIQNSLCTGGDTLNVDVSANANGGACANTAANGATKVNDALHTGINVFSIIVGIVAVIMIIVGGFRYITSSGNSEKVTSAKNTIIYAIIGLIIVALAQIIVRFVLNKTTQ